MNGADDNAAAVGSVVEVACRLGSRKPGDVALAIALWDAEEPPYFMTPQMGSASFVADPPFPLSSIDVVVVLDLVGGGLWAGAPFHVALGAETAAAVAEVVAGTPVPDGLTVVQAGLHLVERIVGTTHVQPWSDYAPFREAGVPVLFLSNGQSHHYHTPTDDFETLDLGKLGLQTDWLAALIAKMLQIKEKPAFVGGVGARPEVDHAAALALIEAAIAVANDERPGVPVFDAAALARDRAELTSDGRATPETHRRAVQRVQCYASGHYPPEICARL